MFFECLRNCESCSNNAKKKLFNPAQVASTKIPRNEARIYQRTEMLTLLWIVQQLPMCALIIATFSAFFPLKVILWWEKYEDSSSTLKDDSFSVLHCPTQSVSLYSQFSCSIRSLSVSYFFFSLHIFSWARCSTYSDTSFSGTLYLSKNFFNSLSFPTD